MAFVRAHAWCAGAWLLTSSTVASAHAPTPLASLPRVLEVGAPLPCQDLPLVPYRGTDVPFSRSARVHQDFVANLRAFEKVVVEVAVRHYGRAPRRLRHLGAFNCRRMRRYPTWVSEHALGNALDLAGFQFGPLPRTAQVPAGLPRRLRRAFSVDVQQHFRAKHGLGQRHAAFLHDLTRALIARPDIFSVVLGPGYPGHENHLHLDAAPYRVVDVDLPAP